MVTSIKIDIFLLVTTRPITHKEQFVCIQNSVGKFSTETGQPLVTTNGMLNHMSYHHKAYYTYIEMYIQMYNAIWTPERSFDPQQNLSFLLSKGPY